MRRQDFVVVGLQCNDAKMYGKVVRYNAINDSEYATIIFLHANVVNYMRGKYNRAIYVTFNKFQ